MNGDRPSVERMPLGEETWLSEAWNGKAADGYPCRLAEVLPHGYQRYLRIFHPFLPRGSAAGPDPARALRTGWEELARAAGLPFSSRLIAEDLDPVLGVRDGDRPLELWEGELHPVARTALFAHLAARSSGPAFFYFGVATLMVGPLLYRASCSAVDEVKRAAAVDAAHREIKGPEYAWPSSRSWFVSTDFDCASTYLGCDDDLAARVLDDPAIEALDAELDDRLE